MSDSLGPAIISRAREVSGELADLPCANRTAILLMAAIMSHTDIEVAPKGTSPDVAKLLRVVQLKASAEHLAKAIETAAQLLAMEVLREAA
jgi:hypothetical protein